MAKPLQIKRLGSNADTDTLTHRSVVGLLVPSPDSEWTGRLDNEWPCEVALRQRHLPGQLRPEPASNAGGLPFSVNSSPSLRSSHRRRLHILSLLLCACNHGAPFTSESQSNGTPFAPAEPLQLTFSTGEDQYPTWHPNGQSILYSYVDPVTSDRCLSLLPMSGGQSAANRCPTADPRNDSLDVMVEPAIRGDGRIAWVEEQNVPDRGVPDRGAVQVGTLDSREHPLAVVRLPYLATTGSVHLTAAYLRWLPQERLAYVGTDLLIRAICFGCRNDTIVIGREIMLVDATTAFATPVPLQGTAEATSVWPTADSAGVYYTLAGDTRVWMRPLAGGQPEIVHDFGASQIVRDVSVRGDRLAAIVGGNVHYGFEAVLGQRQVDSGGVVTTVDLRTHEEQHYPKRDVLFRRPVLSPDGRRLVVEGVAKPETHPDLWLFELP